MNDLQRYLDAATRTNTRRSYDTAVRHFEEDWGGYLPATADSVARYLVDYAGKLSINTLKQRLAALAQWHTQQGFTDPTRASVVRKVLKGIQALHPNQERRAAPLHLTQLAQVADWLEVAAASARVGNDRATELRSLRDRALILVGFWRGFRGDELIRLRVEHITVAPGHGMTCFLPRTKSDRGSTGTTFKVPALSRWCPVSATVRWLTLTGMTQGPLLRGVDRWAHVSDSGLHANSVIPLLRRLFTAAGLPTPDAYSAHSLRRGFAGWATENGWDVKTLMEYVGWKDVHSALRYINAAEGFGGDRFEVSLGPTETPRRSRDPQAHHEV
jgi:integrase